MGSLGMVLVLLVQFWALPGAADLKVQQQGPKLLVVKQGSRVTLTCSVTEAQISKLLRVEWTKDDDILCGPHITYESPKHEDCGPWGQFCWQPPYTFILQLDHVTLNDSGHYVCGVTAEIPHLEEAKSNGTELRVETGDDLPELNQVPSFPGDLCPALAPPDPTTAGPPTSPAPPPLGLHPAALAAGCGAMVLLSAIALGAGIWSRRRRRRCRRRRRRPSLLQESENPLYSNVLYRQSPKRAETWPAEKALGIPADS